MIVVWIHNGLGNQMFQYAFGLYIKYVLTGGKGDIFYDLTDAGLRDENIKICPLSEIFEGEFKLVDSNELDNIIDDKKWRKISQLFKIDSKRNSTFFSMYCQMIQGLSKSAFLFEKSFYKNQNRVWNKVEDIKIEDGKLLYVAGYWEDCRFLDVIRNEVLQYFRFKPTLKENNYVKQIISVNSVAVHVRRGDYIRESENFQDRKYGTYYNLCDKNYYDEAIQYLNQKENNLLYVFFSDDLEYVLNSFSHIENKIVVCGNKNYEDMYLMSICKHNIVANSTFSFWGAYLNLNEGVIVVPKIHYIFRKGKRLYYKKFPKRESWHCIDNTKAFLERR